MQSALAQKNAVGVAFVRETPADGGVEYMLIPNWSVKLEYQYYNFGDVIFVSAPPVVITTFTNDAHTLKLGVNYRFNWRAGMADY